MSSPNHLVPVPNSPQELEQDKSAQIADVASELGDISDTGIPELKISPELAALMARGLHSAKLPKALRSQRAAEAFQDAFDIIGGTVRLAMWADKNPDKFFAIFGRQIAATMAPVTDKLPQQTKDQQPQAPAWLTARRLAYQESNQVIDDIALKDDALKDTRDGG